MDLSLLYYSYSDCRLNLLVESPNLEQFCSRNILEVFYPTGRHTAWPTDDPCLPCPSREAWAWPKRLDGLSWVHHLFLRDEAYYKIYGFEKWGHTMSNKNRCSPRTSPANRKSHQKSHKPKTSWRKVFFQIAFKAIEAAWMIVQVIQYLSEIIRRWCGVHKTGNPSNSSTTHAKAF